MDETDVKGAGRWRYVVRAIDQFGQVIDVLVAAQRDGRAAHCFFEHAIGTTRARPMEVGTDLAPVYPATLEELLPAAWHRTDRYGNNGLEADHGRLKARLRPLRGLNPGPQRQDPDCRARPACRTSAEATTSSRSRSRRLGGWRSRSTSFPWRSDPSAGNGFGMPPVDQMQQSRLDHLLIAGRRQLVRVLHLYVKHCNRHRPHRGLGLSAPERSERCQQVDASAAARQLHRRDVLGGLIHEYERAA